MGIFGRGDRGGASASEAPEWIRSAAGRLTPPMDPGHLSAILSHPETDARFGSDSELRRVVATELSQPGCIEYILGKPDPAAAAERIASSIAWRRSRLLSVGAQTSRRIADEAHVLVAMSDAALAERFSESPRARLDAPAADAPRRRSWVMEMLAGEAAAISSGMLSPAAVAVLARRCRLPLPTSFAGPSPDARQAAFHSSEDLSRSEDARRGRARLLASSSPAVADERFALIPGYRDAAGEDRLSLMFAAVVAEEVRRLARLPGASASGEGVLPIVLSGLSVSTSDGLAFEADLVVAGERVCRIEGRGAGELEAHSWSEGFSPEDLVSLDTYFGATGEPREDGTVVDSLALRILDIVSMRVAVDAYVEAATSAAFFRVEGSDGPWIARVPIPQGGDRDGAISFMLGRDPAALPLDRMPVEDAAMTWIALS